MDGLIIYIREMNYNGLYTYNYYVSDVVINDNEIVSYKMGSKDPYVFKDKETAEKVITLLKTVCINHTIGFYDKDTKFLVCRNTADNICITNYNRNIDYDMCTFI